MISTRNIFPLELNYARAKPLKESKFAFKSLKFFVTQTRVFQKFFFKNITLKTFVCFWAEIYSSVVIFAYLSKVALILINCLLNVY